MDTRSSTEPLDSIVALIVAAGRGTRAGAGGPKQYRTLGGQTVLARSILALLADDRISSLICVIHPADMDAYNAVLSEIPLGERARLMPPVFGGPQRQDSVRFGLEALATFVPPALVLVHDAARPFVSRALIDRAITTGVAHGASIPALAVTDTLKTVDLEDRITGTLDRTQVRAVQTPQAFAFQPLLDAHRAAAQAGIADLTDDAAVLEYAGRQVHCFDGERANVKLTTHDDFLDAERRISLIRETRTGLGYDVHAFGPGDHVMLAGVSIPHDRGLLAHSDGDVALHALTDAVFGALSDGDIGSHFPPSDPQWKGAASDQFLSYAMERLRLRGGTLVHCDLTLICEEPKIGPHRDAMREKIAQICGVSITRIAVKATTSERLGFTGRKEGIAAQAIVTVTLTGGDD